PAQTRRAAATRRGAASQPVMHDSAPMKIVQRARRALVLIGGALLLAACAGHSGPREVPPAAEFSARILADDTKLFTLRLPLGPAPGERREGAVRRSGEDCFRCEAGQRPLPAKPRTIDMKGIATAILAENHYCRDGFIVLEQFAQDRTQVLRGECRDGASAADRARYPQR